ncbi:uncharacterized protein ASPGLDRAFT_78405 [Aspergillus glaucus CBS 516.65]|uniref:Transcription factor domain-containing protein n=1 Tax=Aspergillus glaucus CBS 516.65 TaxID=1160497 RepID=A0A1L9VZ74_ASPGL|nr:hypothetical protein ASPGLDRAFT_78405 [Aspergillus glaucus CBS 516.65]OJJ89179.1 hypothetical protein ASPGLDRAFT_78405 [Aspergillus glaucus CBS 516.65]
MTIQLLTFQRSLNLPHQTSLKATHTPWLQIGPSESCLLRYFVEELARWFDICDPSNHFESTIPQRARECFTLRHVILAASARHFSTLPTDRQTATFQKYNMKHDITIDEETVLYYHNQCITDLRSLAAQPDAIMDENLLAAVVILRFYEELDNPFVALPTETAARGLHVFIEAQAQTALSPPPTLPSNSNANGTLRQAVFWTGFQQEFHMAFSQQRPFRLPLSLSVTQGHLVWIPASDAVWTNRLLIIGARVIQYCYNDTFPGYGSVAGYRELLALRGKWVRSRPISFSPVYIEEPNPEEKTFFPGIWYLDDCHIVAAQTLSLLDILFTAYSPYIPRIGSALHLEMENVDEKLRTAALEICGIAISNK